MRTAGFFKLVGDRYYDPRHDGSANRWDVYLAPVSNDDAKGQ